LKPTLKKLFEIPPINTKKARQQRASGANWSKAQKANAKQYMKSAKIKKAEGTFKNG
jgi:hypothetical protein